MPLKASKTNQYAPNLILFSVAFHSVPLYFSINLLPDCVPVVCVLGRMMTYYLSWYFESTKHEAGHVCGARRMNHFATQTTTYRTNAREPNHHLPGFATQQTIAHLELFFRAPRNPSSTRSTGPRGRNVTHPRTLHATHATDPDSGSEDGFMVHDIFVSRPVERGGWVD